MAERRVEVGYRVAQFPDPKDPLFVQAVTRDARGDIPKRFILGATVERTKPTLDDRYRLAVVVLKVRPDYADGLTSRPAADTMT